jgi:gluconate kinase
MAERKHRYMPASLLQSQFVALEPPAKAIRIDVAEPPERCVERIREVLQS